MKFAITFVVLFTQFATVSLASEILICQTEAEKYKYRIELAQLILDKTATEYESSKIVSYVRKGESDPSQARCLWLLFHGMVDLIYMPATTERLELYQPVKVDIHNGMLGYRVLLIHKKNQHLFTKIKSVEGLKKFKGGFGAQWGDYKIFALNNLPVVGVINTHYLIPMLNAGRFDYFHRGLHEAWLEIESYQTEFPDLKVEENLVLVYDLPVYFMFNIKNKSLKNRFLKGFEIIKKDGSFKELFLKHFGHIAKKANLKNRTFIRIKYHNPEGLPPIDTDLWYRFD